ncbi:MAG: peptidoglycan-associated lipoprotein Pal [Azoarcus sp.]|jgi:peptidoglycan-associated lipoprotein|nr:peptidoglycan-associated lipoprotein Pal [Azoarcus sp.]
MKKLLVPSLMVFALAACETDDQKNAAIVDDAVGAQKTNVVPVDPPGTRTSDNLPDSLKGSSVFFDYDSYVIRTDARSTVEAHARFLAQQPSRKVTIQGNADERGSREYNLALGQKRAEAVRRALRLQGANDTQIEAVSMGKEHPRCTASTESCYAQNRRGDFVYLR